MATLDDGNIRARCPGCQGAYSTFEYQRSGREWGVIRGEPQRTFSSGFGNLYRVIEYRLFRCAGCGAGGIGSIEMPSEEGHTSAAAKLRSFHPEAMERASLPEKVPPGIQAEFREAERCMEAGCLRAAAGLFRSVLDKTLRANGYKLDQRTSLLQQINMASDDGVITQARKRRAHDEIRVLGNDVLHDEWHPIALEDVWAARHYAQRILEDLYDDRDSVLIQLRSAGRIPAEDVQHTDADADAEGKSPSAPGL